MIGKYRKKPVVIEAVQWTGENLAEVCEFARNKIDYGPGKIVGGVQFACMKIETLEGDMKVNTGDYIIKGVNGEFYPCKPDIFKKTYEAVEA